MIRDGNIVLPSPSPDRHAHRTVWVVAAVMILVGGGGALTVPPIASLVLDRAPGELAGTASGVLNTFRQLGGSLGVAGIGAVIAAVIVLGATAILSTTFGDPDKQAHR